MHNPIVEELVQGVSLRVLDIVITYMAALETVSYWVVLDTMITSKEALETVTYKVALDRLITYRDALDTLVTYRPWTLDRVRKHQL